MAFRSSADGIAKKGKTKGTCIVMKGSDNDIPNRGGGYPLTPTTMPRDIKLPNGAKP
jgi:hypothetical protein